LRAPSSETKGFGCQSATIFGPKVGNSWFAQGLLKPGQPVRSIANPADPGVGHQWAYVPDVARTMVALLARREMLQPFERFHMAGHWDANGVQMAQAIQRVVVRATGRTPRIGGTPWWMLRLASPFNETLRELLEMRYLWKQPVRMVNDRLLKVLGHEPHTPLDQAIEATLIGLACLPLADAMELRGIKATA